LAINHGQGHTIRMNRKVLKLLGSGQWSCGQQFKLSSYPGEVGKHLLCFRFCGLLCVFWTPAPCASLPNQGGEWKHRNEYGNQSSGRPWIFPQHLKFIYWRIEFCGDKYQFPSSPNLVVKVKFEGRGTFSACLFHGALINVDWLIICVFLTWCTLYCRSARGKSSISACKKEHSANKETLFAYFLAHQPTIHPVSGGNVKPPANSSRSLLHNPKDLWRPSFFTPPIFCCQS